MSDGNPDSNRTENIVVFSLFSQQIWDPVCQTKAGIAQTCYLRKNLLHDHFPQRNYLQRYNYPNYSPLSQGIMLMCYVYYQYIQHRYEPQSLNYSGRLNRSRSSYISSVICAPFSISIFHLRVSHSLRYSMNLNATQILHRTFRVYDGSIICWFVYEICQLTGTESFLRGSKDQYICAQIYGCLCYNQNKSFC